MPLDYNSNGSLSLPLVFYLNGSLSLLADADASLLPLFLFCSAVGGESYPATLNHITSFLSLYHIIVLHSSQRYLPFSLSAFSFPSIIYHSTSPHPTPSHHTTRPHTTPHHPTHHTTHITSSQPATPHHTLERSRF